MKAFITGMAGFTGKHLKAWLQQKEVEVTGIDLRKSSHGYKCDLGNKKRLGEILSREKPDYVFHLASPVIRSDQLIDEALKKNLMVDLFGSVNLLQTAGQLKKKPKILITGTNAEYRIRSGRKIKESDPLEPVTAYGLSKLTQELVSRKLAESYDLELVYSRTFHLIGPGQLPGFVVTDLARRVAMIEKSRVKAEIEVGNLKIRRDFTDVREAARAYWLLMQKGKPGEAYNVCSGKADSIKEIIDIFQALSRKKFKVKGKKQWRRNDPLVIRGDNQKIKKAVGWKPEIELEESIKDTLDYWRKRV